MARAWFLTSVVAFTETAKLTFSNAAGEVSVATLGDTVVVGAGWEDEQKGAAFVFTQQGGLIQKLSASDASNRAFFGYDVALCESFIAIGAYGDNSLTGAVYIFRDFHETQKLVAGGELAFFGLTIAVSNKFVVVGTVEDELSGSVYVFRAVGLDFQLSQKLTASDPEPGDVFGFSLALAGSLLAVGIPGDHVNGPESGSVVVFEAVDDTFRQIQKLTPSDAASTVIFGYAVAMSGSTIVVGAPQDASGSIYIFKNLTQTNKLRASDANEGDNFGYAVALSGSTLVVGAIFDDDDGEDSGSAYIYENLEETQKLTASDAMPQDWFGDDVAISDGFVVIGAPGEAAAYCFASASSSGDGGSSKKKKTATTPVLPIIITVVACVVVVVSCLLFRFSRRPLEKYPLDLQEHDKPKVDENQVIEFSSSLAKGAGV